MVARREEEGGGVDETHNPFVGDEKLFDKRAVEMQKRLTRRDGSTMTLAQVSCCTDWVKAVPQLWPLLCVVTDIASMTES
jgi:hypothetical protein